ncbi:MAG TPA: Gldg family protein [Verrucomicrobiota bacterium]|nr:hypothetical protein [Verrucomicrobiales bacterium]HRI14496.1 Gldg family protein [Verrucomicrobiota bacterium]
MNIERSSFEPGRRVRTTISAVVSVLAAIAIVGLLNFLAVTRKIWRYDVAAQSTESLSPLTRQILAAQTNDLRITILFDPESDLYPHVDSLLREYAARSPHLQVQTIDYLRNPGAAELAKVRYQLGAGATDLIIFDAGDRHRVVSAGELSVFNSEDTQAILAGEEREIRRSGFSGEYHFTSAIAALQERGETKACYLLGHGEHPPDSQEPLMGYARLLKLLTGEKNLTVEYLKLNAATNQIPADCPLLIIAGPTAPLLPVEVAKIEAFLQRGGRLLVLLHPYAAEKPSGLEELLQRWGIAAPPAYAGDEQFTSYTKLDVISQSFGSHALVAPLRRAAGALYFPLPRIVAPMPANQMPADAPRAEVLVSTSEHGLTRSNLKGGNAGFDPAKDAKNTSVPIAVAAEKGGVAGVAAGRGTTRIVAIGDSTMFANETLDKPRPEAGNRDFAGLVVSWLLDRPQSMAISPKPIREYRLSLTARQQRLLRWTLVAGLPGAILLLGVTVWSRRRA